jgi:hypothetical protein
LRLRPHRARDELNHLLRFTSFVRQQLGGLDIGLIDQDLIDAYRSMLLATTSGATRHLARYLKPITELRRLGPYLSGGGLSFLPWNGRSCYRLFDSRPVPQENRTPRIPEPVIGALLHWSLRYVDLFSHDIFAARAELNALMKRRAARPRRRKNDVVNRIVAWIDARRTAGRGIPVWNSPAAVSGHAHKLSREAGFGGEVLNLQLIVLQTDLNAQTIQENGHALQLIRDAVAELGFERGGMDTPISIDPDTGLPWRSRFDAHSLREEEVNLQSAAYVLCAYLTGMRDSEVQAMRSGCIRRSLSADGLVERLAVQSTVYKDRGPEARPPNGSPLSRSIARLPSQSAWRPTTVMMTARTGSGSPYGEEAAGRTRALRTSRDRSAGSTPSSTIDTARTRSPRSRWSMAGAGGSSPGNSAGLSPGTSPIALRRGCRQEPVQACLGRHVRWLCGIFGIGLPSGNRAGARSGAAR